jgi:hypothetical protein
MAGLDDAELAALRTGDYAASPGASRSSRGRHPRFYPKATWMMPDDTAAPEGAWTTLFELLSLVGLLRRPRAPALIPFSGSTLDRVSG